MGEFLLFIILLLFFWLCSKLKERKNYWKLRNVPQLEFSLTNIVFGDNSFFELGQQCYKQIKAGENKYGGIQGLGGPTFIPVDPEVIRNILVKDHDHFMSHGVYYNEKTDPLHAHLFNLEGAQWKKIRQNLSPTFTSQKIKLMHGSFVLCSEQLTEILDKCAKNREAVEISDIFARLTTDIIANVAFGIECNSVKNPDTDFRKYGKRIFYPANWSPLKLLLLPRIPKSLINILGIKMLNAEVESFFFNTVRNNAFYREKNNIKRNDFFQLLLELKKNNVLTIEELAAQCYLFFIAGFDTSSNTMAFTLYELGKNQDIQEKLRNSIQEVVKRHDDKISYEAVNEMSYLNMVLCEALRKYPIFGLIPRECTKRYQLPGTDVILDKGVKVWIPVLGIHWDPEFYQNPHIFDPSRFSEDNLSLTGNKMAYLPFGTGPRQCLGQRFGLLQSKVGLAVILKDFKVTLAQDGPISFRPRSGITASKHEMYFNFSKIS